jgi:sensor histidine kinase YesM
MLNEFAIIEERLRNAVRWKQLRIIFLADTLIALFLYGLDMLSGENEKWLYNLAVTFIFTHAIGTSIYFLICLSGLRAIEKSWWKLASLIILFMLGGWIGSFIAIGIIDLLLEPDLQITNFKTLVLSNTFFAVAFGVTVFGYFLLRSKLEQFAARLAEKEIAEHRLLRLKTKAELEALRAKVNPHFLFNTLNSIASLIPVDPVKAEEMVQKLAHLLRFTLDASNHELMKLADELEVIREYLAIEKIRLGERLSYEISIDDTLTEVSIPGLLLQPLVENSVKHGIAPTKSGGHINISCRHCDGHCQIEIVDTGKGFNASESVEGFGLSGVRERLALHYGSDYAFEMTANSGVRILLRLPLETSSLKRQESPKGLLRYNEKPNASALLSMPNG